jgi:lysophospholipase L1-like esterase
MGMKSSKMLWRIVGSIAFISTLLFIFGFIYAAQDIINPKPSDLGAEPAPTNNATQLFPKGEITIMALGDSLTKGTGDISGDGGYVGKAQKTLSELWKKPVHVVNQAVNGWRADSLLQFIDQPNIQNLIQKADIIMLSIGANDLNYAANSPIAVTDSKTAPVETTQPSSQSDINYAEIKKNLPIVEGKLTNILTKIAALNSNARIVYVGLYNPYFVQDIKKEGSAILQEWNLKAAQIANSYPNMIVVPTFDLFQFDIKNYLYIDEFHPNSLGYERIAARVVQALQ